VTDPTDPVQREAGGPPEAVDESGAAHESRPMIERLGLTAIAALLAVLFGGVSVASWNGGELFLAVMAGVGCLMTLWVGALTLLRG
jgi:hypothetical protein